MGGLSVFAVQVARRGSGLNSLAFVAALMALFSSCVLWDVSFQLSFAATLLQVESGYAPLNPPEWVARWQPQLVLLSVGAGDVQGLPDPEMLEAVQGYTLLRTDQNGWIELTTDGEQMWVEVEKK